MDGSPNTELIRENTLKVIWFLVEFVDAIFPVYKQKQGGSQKIPSLLYNEEFLKWPKEKAIDMGMGDTFYTNFVPFTMDEFNGLNPSRRIQMDFKSSSADPVQDNDLLHKTFVHNSMR